MIRTDGEPKLFPFKSCEEPEYSLESEMVQATTPTH